MSFNLRSTNRPSSMAPKELCSFCGKKPFDLVCHCGKKFDFSCVGKHIDQVNTEFDENVEKTRNLFEQMERPQTSSSHINQADVVRRWVSDFHC